MAMPVAVSTTAPSPVPSLSPDGDTPEDAAKPTEPADTPTADVDDADTRTGAARAPDDAGAVGENATPDDPEC